jgi:tRNA-specific 2-thiouridylase
MKIAVGLSGGVDSAVTAYLLKQAGHEVIGATMKIWDGRTIPGHQGNSCYGPDEERDIADAQSLCNLLGVPYHVIDCSEQYNDIVLRYFDEEYRAGRTPNPCVRCNEKVKFDLLPLLLEKSGIFFNYFATGHYARIDFDRVVARYLLKRGVDGRKDQSYFLYRLSQKQLSKIVFPLGGYTKEKVRAIAGQAGLPMHDKEESQDFCSGDYTKILSVTDKPGNFVDPNGKILGQHTGIWNFTIGQRKGTKVAGGVPLYVVAIDAGKNEIVLGTRELLQARGLRATDLNMIAGKMPERALVKTRSASEPVPCTVAYDGFELTITFDEPQLAITPGQSAVVYDGDVVAGGGIIAEAIKNSIPQ